MLLCAMLLVWPQHRNMPDKPSGSATLLQQAQQAFDAKQYAAAATLCDSALSLMDEIAQRAEWYNAVKLRTRAQVEDTHAPESLLYLLRLLQKQTQDDSITAKLYGLAGFACLYADDNEQGAWYYERSLEGLQRHHCKMGIGTAYMNIGYALKAEGDYRAAKPYYLAALPLLRREGNIENLAEALINLGDISRYLFEFEAAQEYYLRASQEFPDTDGRLAAHLGWVEADQGRCRQALDHFQKSCRQAPCAADLARIMGHCSETLGDTTEANRQFHLALESATDGPDSARAQWYIGQTLLRRQRPEAALRVFQQALHGLFPSVLTDDPASNPRIGKSVGFWPVGLLRGKAQALHALYTKTNKVQHLHLARNAVSVAMAALDTLRTGMRNETSGQDAVDYAYSTYETGIRIALEMDRAEPGHSYTTAAYEMAERAKSNVLKTNLLEKDLRRNIHIPDSLLWQESIARAAVAYWEEAKRPDSLLAATRRLERVRLDIEKQAPLLSKARLQTQSISIAAIQDNLAGGELLLQYFWGDSTIVVFAVGKQRLNTYSIPRTAALDRSLDTLRSALTNWRLSPNAYFACAAPVYRHFCAPLLEAAGTIKRLIIVPDGPLWAVPFEALCKGSDGRFLIQDHSVSYHWSGALWMQARTQGHLSTAAYGGFAPQYSRPSGPMATLGSGLGDLPEARAAVAAAAETWGGTVWQGPAVDKSLFQREAGRYGILHLAMHGLLDLRDRTRTGLAFPAPGDSIRLLNTLEISQMDLSAQLAVLSACNTGSGVVFRGEGVMSLSRAFALAGCPALTANLWEVPSRETNDITAAFLRLLQSGKSKDESLRSAKLDFLNTAEAERRHPFFWAGQVLIGNEQPIRRSREWFWWLCAAVLLCGLSWIGWQRWRMNQP